MNSPQNMTVNHEDIVAQVNQVMHEGFEIPFEKLTPAATLFDELQLDSLDAVDMLVHLEEKLKVKMEGERLREVRTMQDIYQLVESVALSSATAKQQGEHGH